MRMKYSDYLQELMSENPRDRLTGALRLARRFLNTDSLAVSLYDVKGKHVLVSQEGYPHKVASVFASEHFYTLRTERFENRGYSTSTMPTWEAASWQSTPIAQYMMRTAGFYEGISLPLFGPQDRIVGFAHTNIRSEKWPRELEEPFIDFCATVSELTHLIHTRLSANLTLRETEILRLLQDGLTTPEIALKLDISDRTVSTHVQHILEKTHTKNRTQAAIWATQHGYSS